MNLETKMKEMKHRRHHRRYIKRDRSVLHMTLAILAIQILVFVMGAFANTDLNSVVQNEQPVIAEIVETLPTSIEDSYEVLEVATISKNNKFSSDKEVTIVEPKPEDVDIVEVNSTMYVTAKSGVNVRSFPSLDSDVLGKYGYGKDVYVLHQDGDWSYIENDEYSGYINTEYLSDVAVTPAYTDEELYILTHIITGEAQGESDEEQRLVASVFVNRVNSSKFPDTFEEVAFQPGQYACTRGAKTYYREPTERNWENAKWVLENGSILPENVLYQSGSPLGKVYVKTKCHYYCYN